MNQISNAEKGGCGLRSQLNVFVQNLSEKVCGFACRLELISGQFLCCQQFVHVEQRRQIKGFNRFTRGARLSPGIAETR